MFSTLLIMMFMIAFQSLCHITVLLVTVCVQMYVVMIMILSLWTVCDMSVVVFMITVFVMVVIMIMVMFVFFRYTGWGGSGAKCFAAWHILSKPVFFILMVGVLVGFVRDVGILVRVWMAS